MTYADHKAALSSLRRIGYYRFSAYTYPFRVISGGKRTDTYVPEATFEAVERLYDFDAKLRAVTFSGLEAYEVGLRVQIAYTLGKRHTFGHLEPTVLDNLTCTATRLGSESTAYDAWLARYGAWCTEARDEDFVRDFHEKYDGRLPVWVATEVMNLGGLVRLLGFLHPADRKEIAQQLAVGDERTLTAWCRQLNLLRNHCAHGARLWNRRFAYAFSQFYRNKLPPELEHLTTLDQQHQRKKLYPFVAVLAYLMSKIDSSSNCRPAYPVSVCSRLSWQ